MKFNCLLELNEVEVSISKWSTQEVYALENYTAVMLLLYTIIALTHIKMQYGMPLNHFNQL